ncbi:GTPase HflX [Marinilactibacillus psychrotolerans]|uniref:GTPase HflX n=1 Tax=Marinilactibacillus psychrotolerans TaxID=191770 RepID=A0AAV3WUP0_9LACT|nr:GTPase HflX [Marinilactibacillus psychrotolerans]GEL67365.1 GTPase HflX [Marinilactibacillus psychrotolerans]GEQ36308.1 GTP-binding protein [Marinilactibacillus psychrotolerans]SDC94744.1 GTP-binding protein HflX [Marinilactibacillus psychrotolerans]
MSNEEQYEKVVVVGVQTTETDNQFHYSLEELKQLVENAGGEVVGELTQKRERQDAKTVVGKGKLTELKHLSEELSATTIVFNQELSPRNVRNIQEEIEAKVIDRIQVILDIFALRAQSKEGRLQVKLAQLSYLLPRLAGQGVNMSRLGAGIGTRGPGETKLETDRRHIQKQMTDIRHELKKTEAHRERSREQRKQSNIFQIGLIGYTNAGKSTILNVTTETSALEKNQLFATLDPLTRQVEFPSGLQATMTDTVGFIQDLPTQLIEAFQSTLEESKAVDLLLHVVDASEDNIAGHEQTVIELLKELNMDEIPRLTVYNKKDLIKGDFQPGLYPNIVISARDDDDIDNLFEAIEKSIKKQMIPYTIEIESARGDLLIQLRNETIIERQLYDEENQVYFVEGYTRENSRWNRMH